MLSMCEVWFIHVQRCEKSAQMRFGKSRAEFSFASHAFTEFCTIFSPVWFQSCKLFTAPCSSYHTSAGGETDTYTWSQQGSPEICFCTGGNRAFSRGICDLKTSPDRRGCPVPCLRGNGMRQTHTHRVGCGNWNRGCSILQKNKKKKAVTQNIQAADSTGLGAHQIKRPHAVFIW